MTVSNQEPDVDRDGKRRRSTAVRPTDDALLDGVVTAFGARGFDRVTMDELAAAADTSKPTLYAHFGGKERLFEACARREAHRLTEWMTDSYQRAAGLGVQMHTEMTTKALFDFAVRHGDGFRVLFGSASGPAAQQIAAAAIAPIVEAIADLIRIEQRKTGSRWGASAEFCAAVVADIAIRGVTQAVERGLDFDAAAALTVSMIVATLKHLDADAAHRLDKADGPMVSQQLGPEPVLAQEYPELVLPEPVAQDRPGRAPGASESEVLDTTMRIFRTCERFEIGAVASALGIGRTTLYRWYGSREGLLAAAFARGFAQLVLRVDRRQSSRGAARISDVLDEVTRVLAADPALRGFLDNEAGTAVRLITRADGVVHSGSVTVIEAMIERARRCDGYRPPVDSSALASALARTGEAFLYSDHDGTEAGLGADIDHLEQVQRLLLGTVR
ncbi:QsdR family transcriptional regulator [Nocardia niwae]|uniref:QsdR family transcriptional regulator n=1 Tax=Nocardia niwae TaxID=626084 RepID=A0ABV2XCA4_9NOCA